VTGSRKDINAHFDELVDLVVRASMGGEHLLVLMLWRHAARRAHETGNLDKLAKLFRSGVPLSRREGQMLADLFDSSKLMKGKRKLFESAAALYDLAERCAAPNKRRAKAILRVVRQTAGVAGSVG
jgi:hypothetical protein